MSSLNLDLAYEVLDCGEQSIDFIEELGGYYISALLIAVFAIGVGFVAFKLIKRALNKA